MDHLPKICRQHSVTLREEDDIRTSQGFQYKSDEWEEFHAQARNSIEGLNGNAKGEGHERIDVTAQNLVRRFAAAAVFICNPVDHIQPSNHRTLPQSGGYRRTNE